MNKILSLFVMVLEFLSQKTNLIYKVGDRYQGYATFFFSKKQIIKFHVNPNYKKEYFHLFLFGKDVDIWKVENFLVHSIIISSIIGIVSLVGHSLVEYIVFHDNSPTNEYRIREAIEIARIQKIEHICHGYCRDKVGPDSEAFIRKEYGSTHRYRTVLYCTVNGEMKEFVPPPSVRVNFTSY